MSDGGGRFDKAAAYASALRGSYMRTASRSLAATVYRSISGAITDASGPNPVTHAINSGQTRTRM